MVSELFVMLILLIIAYLGFG